MRRRLENVAFAILLDDKAWVPTLIWHNRSLQAKIDKTSFPKFFFAKAISKWIIDCLNKFSTLVIKLESITFIALKLIDKYTLTNLKYLKIFEQNKMFSC